jgi:hypothetical protein
VHRGFRHAGPSKAANEQHPYSGEIRERRPSVASDQGRCRQSASRRGAGHWRGINRGSAGADGAMPA